METRRRGNLARKIAKEMTSSTTKVFLYVASPVFLFLLGPPAATAAGPDCYEGLGLASGALPDSSLTSDVSPESVGQARLGADGAWCFSLSEQFQLGRPVNLTIDLGRTALVSGVQTQGPSASLHPKEYSRYIRFYAMNSTDEEGHDFWTCCPGSWNTKFFSEDKVDELDVVTTHPFHSLILARRLRLQFQTDLRWAGDDQMCFRIEVLGCPTDVTLSTKLALRAAPPGWLVMTWEVPTVVTRDAQGALTSLTLNVTGYQVATHRLVSGWSELWTNETLMSQRLMTPNPVWGALYTSYLACHHQGLTLDCGKTQTHATLPSEPDDGSLQDLSKKVQFRHPLSVVGVAQDDGAVLLTWAEGVAGWRTTYFLLQVLDSSSQLVVEYTLPDEARNETVEGLSEGTYQLQFIPKTEDSSIVDSALYTLHLIDWESVIGSGNEEGFGAFVTDVSLVTHILWTGTLRVTWAPAVLRATSANESETLEEVQASFYNVTLTCQDDDALPDYANVSSSISNSILVWDFERLGLNEHYTVHLTCDFGGAAVSCGTMSVFTAPPLHWSRLEGEVVVYSKRAREASWDEQEEQCRKREGALVSYGTFEEDNLLRPALFSEDGVVKNTFSSYWHGLSMCHDRNNGESNWSDGSEWRHSLLPKVDAGLEGSRCCVKAVYVSTGENDYVWRGEECKALLPAICEFHPGDLLGKVVDVEKGPAAKDAATVSWGYQPDNWEVEGFQVAMCPVRNLQELHRQLPYDESKCISTTVSANMTNWVQNGLSIFTEYNVTVAPALPSINFIGNRTSNIVRTFPDESVSVQMNSNGTVTIQWSEKVAEFGENDNVVMTFNQGSSLSNDAKEQMISAAGITMGNLTLGENYTLSLTELGGKRRKKVVTFRAFPPCNCQSSPKCQLGGNCYIPSSRSSYFQDASDNCKDDEATLVATSSAEEVELLLGLSNHIRDDLWVSLETSHRKGKDDMDTSLLVSDDVEIIHETNDGVVTTVVTQDETISGEGTADCLLMSRAARSIVPSCEGRHLAACRKQSPVSPIFPPISELEVTVGANWLQVSWNKSRTEWAVPEYNLYYRKTRLGITQGLKYRTFSSPPVTITGLLYETSYTLELEANLGYDFIESTEEFEYSTNNTGSFKAAGYGWGSEGSVLNDYEVLHLVCGALLIACIIATMLLFFATGMFYQDCIAQLGFQACLMSAYFLLLLAHPAKNDASRELGCVVLAVMLHFLFLCALTFLALEALTLAHLLLEHIRSPFQKSNWLLVAAGVSLPVIVVVVSAAILQGSYVDMKANNCFLKGNGTALLAGLIPKAVITLAALLLLGNTFFSNGTPPDLIDVHLRGRQSDSYKLRWVVALLVVLLVTAWASGVAASTLKNTVSHVIFAAATLLLAIAVLGLRTVFDDTFRMKMARLCCGTELTYKRSDILSLSSKSRIAPSEAPPRPSTVERTSQVSAVPHYTLPNTPPQQEDQNHVLIKRTYNFADDSDVVSN
ncbi:uncharacterized protein LOC143039806 isoform X2 [Oratosquilla oratoria]|uniref:uncharacterized protein LOC143039806 isoform X2 n=1 Tax=Oratosquilla oratoria TaxID=337810 RepID=UPI003F760685